MVVVSIPQATRSSESAVHPRPIDPVDWIGLAAGVSLVAGGILLLRGKRRAGMVAAATGTAIVMLDQQETLSSWWKTLPLYLDQAQVVLSKVQDTVDDLAVKRDKLRGLLRR